MKLIICLDERKGMMFNNRRQSRDKVLISDLLKYIGNNRLYISNYSKLLFPKQDNIIVVDNPFLVAETNDYCFIEGNISNENISKCSEIVMYNWNRYYPSDVSFDADLSKFYVDKMDEFSGSSHEKITKEVYYRK